MAAKLHAPCSHLKKKPPIGTQPRCRLARGQTARLGSQHTHKRKSILAESSTTRSCREVENPAMAWEAAIWLSRHLCRGLPHLGAPHGDPAYRGRRQAGGAGVAVVAPVATAGHGARQAWPGQPWPYPGPCAQPATAAGHWPRRVGGRGGGSGGGSSRSGAGDARS